MMTRTNRAARTSGQPKIVGLLAAALLVATAGCGDSSTSTTDAGPVVADTSGGADAHDVTAGTDVASDGVGIRIGEAGVPGEEGRVILADRASGVSVALLPAVAIDGIWHGAGIDGPCGTEDDVAYCEVLDIGRAEARVEGNGVVASFSTAADVAEPVPVTGVALRGEGDVPGARAWMSNGFQSWSQSGALALRPGPGETDDALTRALAARAESETTRTGQELSWWHSWLAGDEAALVAGALDAERFRAWVRWEAQGDEAAAVWLASGNTGDVVSLAGDERVDGNRWFLAAGAELPALLVAYGDALPSRRRSVVAPADAGWNSWYQLWDTVDEEAVRANADIAVGMLAPHIPESVDALRIVVDDGWQRAWGDWFPNEKFPSGLDGLAADLATQGLLAGVWMAPLLAHVDSDVAIQHPEWFVQGAQYLHPANGAMLILDPTHPDAAAHLADTVSRIVGWGYDLLKIDFLFAGTFEGSRHRDVTGMEAYALALSIIREAAGEETILVAVGAPGVPSLPWADAWRLGGDIAAPPLDVAWPFTVAQLRSVGARWPLCHAVLCDADPVMLRTLPRGEIEAGAWVVALAGGALFLSDDLRALDEERRGWALDADRAALSLGATPARPLDAVLIDPPETLVNAVVDAILPGTAQRAPERWLLPDGRELCFSTGASGDAPNGAGLCGE